MVVFLFLSCLLFTFTDCLVPDYPWHGDGSWDTVYIEAFKDHPLRKGINLEWLSFLRNKRIAFIGDSLTRYQYLSLAWFLSSGQWLEDPGLPSLVREKQYGSWNAFFRSTNSRLGCHEILDAFRPEGRFENIRENRYFHHFGLNLTISMNLYIPTIPMAVGADFPTLADFTAQCMGIASTMRFANPTFSNPASRTFNTVQDFVANWVAPFQPDYLIFNQGFWKPEMVHDPSYLPWLRGAIGNTTKHVIWKTTTSEHKGGGPYEDDDLRQRLISLGFDIFDAFALTRHISYVKGAFFDVNNFAHFAIYREMNLALFQFLRDIDSAAPHP
eukprot:gene5548-6110_t